MFVEPFQFFDVGPLVDGELELKPPNPSDVDAVLMACRHPRSLAVAAELARVTRTSLVDFLTAAPMGRHPGDAAHGRSPSYHFWMHASGEIPIRIAGGLSLRIGDDSNLNSYIGHIGYNVYGPAQGRHFAERASRLIFPLARLHGLNHVWITCNPENFASRRTCERLGAQFVEIVPVPVSHELYSRGDRFKCRYRIDL